MKRNWLLISMLGLALLQSSYGRPMPPPPPPPEPIWIFFQIAVQLVAGPLFPALP